MRMHLRLLRAMHTLRRFSLLEGTAPHNRAPPHSYNVPRCCRQPIAKDKFLRHFWHCFNTLKSQADNMVGMPAYFRFMTLLGAIAPTACMQ